MEILSQKQRQIYEYISHCIKTRGYPPSVREIGRSVNLSSPSTVHKHLRILENAGFITRDSGKNRAITLAKEMHQGIPILGSVAAGQPILATQDILGYLPWKQTDAEDCFALKIQGDSMKNAGILNGDTVVVHQQSTAKNGDIVIALLEDEATCKRLSLTNNEIWLLPENEMYQPICGSQATILGKVTAVIRIY